MGDQRVGDMLLKQEDYAAAEANYRGALAIAKRLFAAEPTDVQAQRDLSVSRAKLGDALERQGKRDPALAQYEASLAIIEPLAAADPVNVGLQRDVFKSYELIGSLRLEQGELDAARVAFKAALGIAETLAVADPANGLAQRELSVQRDHLGDVFAAGRDRCGARGVPQGFGGAQNAGRRHSRQCPGTAGPVAEPRAGG